MPRLLLALWIAMAILFALGSDLAPILLVIVIPATALYREHCRRPFR